MPYREKIAWLSLIALAVTFGPYFAMVAMDSRPPQPLPNVHQLAIYAAVVVVLLVILGVGHLVLRRRSPEEARTPPDERDRAIMQRSLGSAYYVLIGGMIVVGVIMPFNSFGWTIINSALFMIVAAEMVRHGVMVLSYRRQA
jgi:hypothetical protein